MTKLLSFSLLFSSAGLASAVTLFTSNFDANTGAHVFSGATDNVTGSSTLNVTWTTDTAISAISSLTAISSTDGGVSTQGGFAQTQNGTATFANPNVVFLSRNHNQATPRSNAQLGYSFTFTLDSAFDIDSFVVASTHTNNTGIQDQAFSSDLVVNISEASSGTVFSQTINEDYTATDGFHDVSFTVTGTTLAAGDYTLTVYQTNMPGGGAYAAYDGITLEGTAVPEPSSAGLFGLAGLALILRRRR